MTWYARLLSSALAGAVALAFVELSETRGPTWRAWYHVGAAAAVTLGVWLLLRGVIFDRIDDA